jgi:hypothetical protein
MDSRSKALAYKNDEHFYEEINELVQFTNKPASPTSSIKSTNSLLTTVSSSSSSTSSSPYNTNSLSSTDKSTKRVRFSSSKSDSDTLTSNKNVTHKKSIFKLLFQANANQKEAAAIELMLNKNSILKNNSKSPSVSSVSSSSLSSSSSTNMDDFHGLVDEFITRYACKSKTNGVNDNCSLCSQYKTRTNTKSSSSSSYSANSNNYNYFIIDEKCKKPTDSNDRLSFRVTNLTLSDIKMRSQNQRAS